MAKRLLMLITLLLIGALPFSVNVQRAKSDVLGDLDGNGRVDIFDIIILAKSFMATPDSPLWNPKADINGDNVIDIFDALIVSSQFGSSQPSTSVLQFKSSFEEPIRLAGRYPGEVKTMLVNGDQGFDWSDIDHELNYVGGVVGPDVDTFLTEEQAHSGFRSLQLLQYTEGVIRNQLHFITDDAVFGTKIYMSRWLYLPANLTIPDQGSLVGVLSHREIGVTTIDFVVGVDIYSDKETSDKLFWHVYGWRGDFEQLWREVNTSAEVPLGRWFRLEDYIYRDENSGVYEVWMTDNGVRQLLFSLHNVKTRNHVGQVANIVAKVYVDRGGGRTYYLYVDDVELYKET